MTGAKENRSDTYMRYVVQQTHAPKRNMIERQEAVLRTQNCTTFSKTIFTFTTADTNTTVVATVVSPLKLHNRQERDPSKICLDFFAKNNFSTNLPQMKSLDLRDKVKHLLVSLSPPNHPKVMSSIPRRHWFFEAKNFIKLFIDFQKSPKNLP